jgi:hypothetical protein
LFSDDGFLFLLAIPILIRFAKDQDFEQEAGRFQRQHALHGIVESWSGLFQGSQLSSRRDEAGLRAVPDDSRNHVSGWYFGNFGSGGVLGFLIVDPATGGMFSLEPREISADLRSRHARFFPKDGELRVALRSDVPKELVTHLKPIPRKS